MGRAAFFPPAVVLTVPLLLVSCSNAENACTLQSDCPTGHKCRESMCVETEFQFSRGSDAGPVLPDVGFPDTGVGAPDGGTGMPGVEEWTLVFSGSTTIRTEFSRFDFQADATCNAFGYNFCDARSTGPITSNASGALQGHSGWTRWGLNLANQPDPLCDQFSGDITLGSVTYHLMGEVLKPISPYAAGSGGPAARGTWDDGTRSGPFEFYDYAR